MLGHETIERSPYLKSIYQSLNIADNVFTENHIPNFSEVIPVNHRNVIFSNVVFTRCRGIPNCTSQSDFVGCHISWICSGSGSEITTILTAAILRNDHLLKRWLEEVTQFRKSRTVWDVSNQKYIFTFGENQGYEVLGEAASFVAAIKHAIGNPHG
jgi:hypothetical protein